MIRLDFSHFIQAPAPEVNRHQQPRLCGCFTTFQGGGLLFGPFLGWGWGGGPSSNGMPCLTPHVWRFRRVPVLVWSMNHKSRFFRGDLYLFKKAHQPLKVSFPPKTSQDCQIAHQSRHMAPPDLCPSTWYWPSPLRDRCLSCHAGMVLWSKRICLQFTHHVCSNRPVLAIKSRSFMHQKNAGLFCMCLRACTSLLNCFRTHSQNPCLSTYWQIYLPISSTICPSTNFRLSVCIYPSIHPSIRPSVHPSVYLFC